MQTLCIGRLLHPRPLSCECVCVVLSASPSWGSRDVAGSSVSFPSLYFSGPEASIYLPTQPNEVTYRLQEQWTELVLLRPRSDLPHFFFSSRLPSCSHAEPYATDRLPACPPLHGLPARPPTPVHDVATKSIPFLATSPGKDRVVLVYSDKIEVRTKVILWTLLYFLQFWTHFLQNPVLCDT